MACSFWLVLVFGLCLPRFRGDFDAGLEEI